MLKIEKVFIFNDVDEDLLTSEHDIGQGWTLRRATSAEIGNQQFRIKLDDWAKRRGGKFYNPPQLEHWTEISPNNIRNRPAKSEAELLEIARVMVLEPNHSDYLPEFLLERALTICDAEFRLGLFFFQDGKISDRWPKFLNFQIQQGVYPGFNNYKRPSVYNIQDIKDTVSLFAKKLPAKTIESIFLFESLDYLPDSTPMKILGYFTILESILTYKRDGLGRQLKRNLKFMDERLVSCGRSLGFEDFANTKIETMISRLYDYRSAIAHGRSQEKSIKAILKARTASSSFIDDLWIHDWLRKLTRRVLFETVREPERISDFVRQETAPNNVYKKCVECLTELKDLLLNRIKYNRKNRV